MVACEDAISELYDQERDLIRQKLDNIIDYYGQLDSYLSSIVSRFESMQTLMDDMGKDYQDALAEATQNYYDSLSNAADIENNIVDIMKKAQEEEVKNWKDIINARRSTLQEKKSYYDFDRNIKDKNKNLEVLKAERAAIEDVTTAEAKARKAKLDAQIADAEQELKDTKLKHEYDLQVNALDDWAKKLEESLDDSNKSVQETLESTREIIREAEELYKTSTDSVNETMDKIVKFYSGMGMSIDGIDLTPNGNYNVDSSSTVTPNISVNTGGSNQKIAEQSTGQITEQMRDSARELIEAMKNESGEIQFVFEQPEFKNKLISMMSDRIVPDRGGVLSSVNQMRSYQVNNNNQPVEIVNHYDALLKVEGNVDEKVAKLLPQQLEQSFDYTTKKLYNQFREVGLHSKRNRIISY